MSTDTIKRKTFFLDINETDFNAEIENIKKRFNRLIEQNKELIKENENLKDEHYKDAEIAAMKQQLEQVQADSRRGFPISEAEQKAILEWQSRHKTEHHSMEPITKKIITKMKQSPCYFYCQFEGTALGTFGICYCSTCERKAEEDYEAWLLEETKKGNEINYLTRRNKKREFKTEKYDCSFIFQEGI